MHSIIRLLFLSLHGNRAPRGPGPPHYRGSAVTLSYTHHTRQDSSGRGIGPSLRLPPDNTQHSKETSMSPNGIRNSNPSDRAVADTRLRPRGHLDRLRLLVYIQGGSNMTGTVYTCLHTN